MRSYGLKLTPRGCSCVSADVLSEEAILKWYKEAHSAKGKSVFLEQMSKFVEWLLNAEEGKQTLIFISSGKDNNIAQEQVKGENLSYFFTARVKFIFT